MGDHVGEKCIISDNNILGVHLSGSYEKDYLAGHLNAGILI